MKNTYEQLSSDERDKIAIYLAHGYNQSDIARILQRNRSTISRELKRNETSQGYLPHRAQKKSQKIRSQSRKKERMRDQETREYVSTKLKEGWSPELIAGRLPQEHPGLTISHETIYQYIYEQQPDFIPHLVRSHKKRRKRCAGTKQPKVIIPGRVFIDERPKEINNRSEIGHWEADTVVSRQSKKALAVLFERASRYVQIEKIKNKQSDVFASAVIKRLNGYPEHLRNSITYDNGTENVEHEKINAALKTDSYFCHPYHSWEKGGVENSIGLIRRFFPKKTNFSTVSSDTIERVESLLNNRPRKCLNFHTPFEVLSLAVALTP